LGAVNRDCWYLYTLNPYASPAGHSLSSLLANSVDFDDGFGASDGEEGTSDSCSSDGGLEDGSDGADSSDDSLGLLRYETDIRAGLNLPAGLTKRNTIQRYPNGLGCGGRGPVHSTEADQTLEIMMSELDPEVMKIFTKKCSATATEATQVSINYAQLGIRKK